MTQPKPKNAAIDITQYWLGEKLSGDGKRAFAKLCEKCDPALLDIKFSHLAEKSIKLKSGRTIHFSPRDSWETLFPGANCKQELLDNLKSISKRARVLVRDIHKLRRSPLVRLLAEQRGIDPRDLLALGRSNISSLPDLRDCEFRTLLELPTIAKELLKGSGPKQRPDRTQLLTEIYRHIYEQWGQWHDSLVRDILNDLEPRPDNPRYTEVGLKQWRFNHALTDRIT